jgi:glycosyltransferase involved in cell wall biosynthesis
MTDPGDAVAGTPLVSVLIDTYNYGRFVEQAIESVLSQDFPAEQMEVLVVDDGSTDDTSERVKKFGARISYRYKPNGGQASAFNFGLPHARGEIVALLDADDFWLPGKLKRVVEEFQSHPEVGMVSHGYLEQNEETGKSLAATLPLVSGDIPRDLRKIFAYCVYPTSALAFRREPLSRLLPVPESIRLSADGYLALLVPFVASVLALPDPLTVYRLHGRNLYSGADNLTKQRRIDAWFVLLRGMKTWFRANGWSGKAPRLLLSHWTLSQTGQQFLIKPPGRLRYFWFLVRQNHTYSSQQSWKFTAFNYIAAFSALILGYERSRLMQGGKGRTIEVLRSFSKGFTGQGGP